jgi:hypothetical protein
MSFEETFLNIRSTKIQIEKPAETVKILTEFFRG